MKAILLIAVNHPYYGQLAANLAMSIKATENTPVFVVYDRGSEPGVKSPGMSKYFDHIIPIEPEFYCEGKTKHYGLLKTKINEIANRAGIAQGLYIDVDSFIIPGKTLDPFWQAIENYSFCMEYRGLIDIEKAPVQTRIGGWATVDSVKGKLKMIRPEVPAFTQSSWIGFDLTKIKAQALFEGAQQAFRFFHDSGAAANLWYKTVPDELCFALAYAITGLDWHNDFNFCYFDTQPFRPDKANILQNFILYTLPSAGGFRQSYAEFYNQMIAKIAAGNTGRVFTQFRDKRKLTSSNHLHNRR